MQSESRTKSFSVLTNKMEKLNYQESIHKEYFQSNGLKKSAAKVINYKEITKGFRAYLFRECLFFLHDYSASDVTTKKRGEQLNSSNSFFV